VLSLPTGPTVEPDDVAAVCRAIRDSISRAGRRLVA
jgi:hypothetical protein